MQRNTPDWKNFDLNAMGYFTQMHTQNSSSGTSTINGEDTTQEQLPEYALISKSYAVGGTGIREGEDTDNAKYYYEFIKYLITNGNLLDGISIIYGGDAFNNEK